MVRLPRLTGRQILIVVHDLVVTAAALVGTFFVRFEGVELTKRLDALPLLLPGFVVYAGCVYFFFGLYKAKWRFASLPDLMNIFRAATVLAVSLLVLDYVLVARTFLGEFFFGKISIAAYWCLQMFLLTAISATHAPAITHWKRIRSPRWYWGARKTRTFCCGQLKAAQSKRSAALGFFPRRRPIGGSRCAAWRCSEPLPTSKGQLPILPSTVRRSPGWC
jgi:FlaA1/EpsC-like NDP-sugar epimerase